MATSPRRGTHSSTPPEDNSSVDGNALELVRSLAQSLPVQKVFKALGSNSELHIVGGTIRDLLLGSGQCDIDLASVLPPEKSTALLEASGLRTIGTGLKHGTITVLVDKLSMELTTFRVPGPANRYEYSSTIEQDLGGRDFTVNALAWSIADSRLIDCFSGLTDLANKTVRAVGNAPDRFSEDPLRLLRMIRFGPARGWLIEPNTLNAAKNTVPQLEQVSIERIRSELEKILVSEFAGIGFRVMHELGILKVILPEMLITVGFEQNQFHKHDVFEHTLEVIDRAPRELILRLTALFHDLGKPESLGIGPKGNRTFYNHEHISEQIADIVMTRLKFSNDQIASVRRLVKLHMRPLDCGPAAVRRLMRDLGDDFDRWRDFKLADAPPLTPLDQVQAIMDKFNSMVSTELERKKGSVYGALAIDGNDLIGLGLTPGRKLGEVLSALGEMVLDNPDLNEKAVLIEQARKLINT